MLLAPRAIRSRGLQGALRFAIALGMVAIATLASLRVLDEPSLAVAAIIPVLAVMGVGAFVLPVHVLPTVALAILAFVPTRFVPNDGPFTALPALALLLGVWVFRRVILGQGEEAGVHRVALGPRLAVYTTGLLFMLWISFSAVMTRSDTSIGWVTAFAASVLLPLVVWDARREVALLRKTLFVAGAIVGAYALVEMVLESSPVWDAVYGALGMGREFGFSVYRARAGFSHTLFLGAFLVIPAALALASWLRTGRGWYLVAGLLSAGGVVATVSRGSIAALGVAAALAAVLVPAFGGVTLRRWLAYVGLSVVGAVVVLFFSPLAARTQSIESDLSGEVRERAISVAIRAADYSGWMGTGPATSGATSRLFDTIIIENSLLQLLISVGIPGLVMFLAFIAALLWHAGANRDPAVILAIVAYIVAITAFNSIDAVRNMHILIGFLALLALHSGQSDIPRSRTSDGTIGESVPPSTAHTLMERMRRERPPATPSDMARSVV